MRTSYKVLIAFVASVAAFSLLRLLLPGQDALAAIPGTLFIAYAMLLAYRYFHREARTRSSRRGGPRN